MILRVIFLRIFKKNTNYYSKQCRIHIERTVNLMITSIKSDNNMLDFLRVCPR